MSTLSPAAEPRRTNAARTLAYVCFVMALAAGLAAVAWIHVPGPKVIPLGYGIVFTLMVALAERLQIRYFFSQHVEALTLVEAMFGPLIFIAHGRGVVSMVGAGMVVANLLGRNGWLKSAFNTAQWIAASSVGVLVFHACGVRHDALATTSSVLALVLAMLAVWLVNQLLISGVLFASSGHPLGSDASKVISIVLLGRGASFAGSAIVGLLMTAAYLSVHWLAPLAMVPLIFLWLAGRAEASVRADRRLLDGLQRATHHLGASITLAEALPSLLSEARAGFEVKEVQLVLVAESGYPTIHRFSGARGEYTVEVAPHPVAETLADTLVEPLRLGTSSGEAAAALAQMGHRGALAAPLRSGKTTIGVLLLLDREGAEGFEAGELSIAGAFARELVGFLARAALVDAIEEERRTLNDIVEHTGDGIVSLDAEGTILSWNAAMATITGYSAEEMIGTRHFELIRPRDTHDGDLHILGWSERYGDASMPAEMQVVSADGATVWLSCSYSRVPGRDGGLPTLIIVARNITKARELELLKDDFIAVVSHELRTPLVPIKGWAQTLLTRGDRLSDDQRRTAVQSILTQAQRLEALVLNILESSRVEAGQAEAMDVVDVAAVAVRVVEDVLAARPDRVIRVQPPQVPCQVRGSTVWVDRALSNLVANAVKYSPDDAPVDVVVAAESGLVTVGVTDRGPGISEESQERIFERFERLEESRKQTGTGLGLYITRRLARAMGGEVAVSSMPGAGSTFVLSLPAVIETSASHPPAPRAATSPISRLT